MSDLLSLLTSGCSFFAGPAGKEFKEFAAFFLAMAVAINGPQSLGKKARNVRAWAVRVNRPTLALLFHVLASQGITSSGLDSAHRGNQAVHLLALLGEPGVEDARQAVPVVERLTLTVETKLCLFFALVDMQEPRNPKLEYRRSSAVTR